MMAILAVAAVTLALALGVGSLISVARPCSGVSRAKPSDPYQPHA